MKMTGMNVTRVRMVGHVASLIDFLYPVRALVFARISADNRQALSGLGVRGVPFSRCGSLRGFSRTPTVGRGDRLLPGDLS